MKKIHSNHRTIKHIRGSILIWSVLLGFVLTSVFFFYSVRQRATITIQRDTAATLNAKTYLESYAEYIEKSPKTNPYDVNFDGITGNVTNIVDEITGIADIGANSITYNFSGEIFIEWNKCSNSLNADLVFNDILYHHDTLEECSTNQKYDDIIGPIPVTNSFVIKTLNAPFYFRITPKDATTQLKDNQWTMDLITNLEYGKKIEIKRTF